MKPPKLFMCSEGLPVNGFPAVRSVFSRFSKTPPWYSLVPAFDVVVTSATPLYSALLLVSLTRISEMELKEGKSSLMGPLNSTFTLLMPSMVYDISAGVVPATTRLELSSTCTPGSVVKVKIGLVDPLDRE
jgi:hypothetical protein